MLAEMRIESVKLPPRSPNLNAYAERFVRTIKESCLEQMILFGEDSLRDSIHQFLDHYHLERNHQGLENRLIIPMKGKVNTEGRIERRERLGGLLTIIGRRRYFTGCHCLNAAADASIVMRLEISHRSANGWSDVCSGGVR